MYGEAAGEAAGGGEGPPPVNAGMGGGWPVPNDGRPVFRSISGSSKNVNAIFFIAL